MFAVDLHTHTRFFHGYEAIGERFDPVGYRALAWFARSRGLDAVALTNHDYYRPLGTAAGCTGGRERADRVEHTDGGRRRERAASAGSEHPNCSSRGGAEAAGREPAGRESVGRELADEEPAGSQPADQQPAGGAADVVSIPGIEISTSRGHVLVVGPDPPVRTEPGALSPREAVDLAHDRGCAAIIAHPYRNSSVAEADVAFDAIEVNGKHPWTWSLVEEIAAQRDLPLVGGSDAHYPVEVGRAHTLVDADRLTPESVVAAIREDRVAPEFTFSPAQRALHWLYRHVHASKDHVDPVAAAAKLERVERGRRGVER